MRILLIIPCYNEAASLPLLLDQIKNIRSGLHTYELTIAVVDDCSTDLTPRIAEQQADVVLHLPVNAGIGGAVQTGLIYAHRNGYQGAIQVDGDGQHPADQIPILLQHHQNTGSSVIIGSRFLEKKGFQSTSLRRGGIRYLSNWLLLLTGLPIKDVTSGFRFFDQKAIAVAANDYPDEYPEPEALILFAACGLTVQEVSVQMRARQGGHSSIRYLTQLYYILKVTLAMFFTFLKYRIHGTHSTTDHPG